MSTQFSMIPDVYKTVLIISGSKEYRRMFTDRGWRVVDNMTRASLVQFTGGEDVSPDLYGEYTHPETHNNPDRDKKEALIFFQALKKNIPMAGICRGGQFLNVMCGGRMYQHVDGHGASHMVLDTLTGEVFEATSTHHQMMIPGKNGVVIGLANEASMKQRMLAPTRISIKSCNTAGSAGQDVEIVHYPEQNALCFQPHPEHFGWDDLANRYFEYIETRLFGSRYLAKEQIN